MDASVLIEHAQTAIANAYSNVSKLPFFIVSELDGMSGYRTRHLYNNMCSLSNATYLEVGTYKGSSLVSALYGNPSVKAYCIDHWEEWGGKEEFFANIEKFIPGHDLTIIEKDSWQVGAADLPVPIDVFMYDGAHSYEDQKRAITHFYPYFADRFIIMIDDWCCDWVDVKRGTMDGIKEMGLRVLYENEIGLVNTTEYHTTGDTFWNGCYVAVCEKAGNV